MATSTKRPLFLCLCGQPVSIYEAEPGEQWWYQHGENPDHRRLFADPRPGRSTLCYEWLTQIHGREGA
jgi:hypothetical protein